MHMPGNASGLTEVSVYMFPVYNPVLQASRNTVSTGLCESNDDAYGPGYSYVNVSVIRTTIICDLHMDGEITR